MTIDIIAFTDKQFATLSPAQLLEVKEAQVAKDDLTAECEAKLRKEKQRLVRNGVFLSDRYTLLEEKMRAEYQARIDLLREGLLFYLRYSMRPDTGVEPDFEAEYVVDYSLDDEARLLEVKTYYETTYTDTKVRFNEFTKDTIAPQYLGELYKPLYDYFLSFAKG